MPDNPQAAPITAAPVAPLLWTAAQCAAAANVSRTVWFSMQACGQIPAACLRRGKRLTRWLASDIILWCNLGCPSKEVFEIHRGPRK